MGTLTLPYLHQYRDRQSRMRYYVRRKGQKTVALPHTPGSPEFMAAYNQALGTQRGHNDRAHGTIGALIRSYCASPAFHRLKPGSQRTYHTVLNAFMKRDGHRLASQLIPATAQKIIGEIGEKRPGMANLTKSVLHRLFRHAIKIRWRDSNPFDDIESYRLGRHHTWTDVELSAYEERWPLGTRERLAFALLLYTGQRGGDVVRMTRADLDGGVIRIARQKTSIEGDDQYDRVAIHPELDRALRAGPHRGLHLIGDEAGRRITRASLTELIHKAASAAGLASRCVPHGLRKAMARRLAEHGATAKEMASVLGHKSLKEVERYSEQAEREKLTRRAMAKLPRGRGQPA